jgi:hypothetical protein
MMPDKKGSEIRQGLVEIRTIGSLKAYEKREKITGEIIADLKRRGKLFKTARGYFYFEKEPAPKLYPVTADSIELSALMSDRYGINQSERREYEHILVGLRNECYLRGLSVEVHRLAHYNRTTGRLYISRFDGWVYRLNGRSISQVPNGTDGVFFWDDSNWQPYKIFRGKLRGKLRAGLLKPLIFDSTNFSADGALSVDDQRWLFSVWLRSHFFASLLPTKPLLLTCGEKGSGKTLALRKWLKLLFGGSGEVTSLERDKQDAFIAAVCSQPLVVFDNVDEHVGWLADNLAQVATGISFKRRQLYTTNDPVEYKPRCFVALNSRTPKFIAGRDDVLDRTLVLQAERLTAYAGEDELLEDIATNRNSLWTELLRGLNRLLSVTPVSQFRTRKTGFRMADFAGFALAVARAEGAEKKATRILRCLEGSRSEMLLGDEPVSLCLEEWLEKRENQGREVCSGELQRELSELALANGVPWPYKSGHSLGQRLAHITSSLSQRFRVEPSKDSANQIRYRFWPRTESLNQPEAGIPAIQPDNSTQTGDLPP